MEANDRCLLNVVVTRAAGNGTVRIAVSGELDASTADRLRATLADIDQTAPKRIELDGSQITFVDSAGLTVLIGAYKGAELRSSEFRVVRPSPVLARLLELTGQYERFVEARD